MTAELKWSVSKGRSQTNFHCTTASTMTTSESTRQGAGCKCDDHIVSRLPLGSVSVKRLRPVGSPIQRHGCYVEGLSSMRMSMYWTPYGPLDQRGITKEVGWIQRRLIGSVLAITKVPGDPARIQDLEGDTTDRQLGRRPG